MSGSLLKHKTRGQIKMFETIGVLIVFIIIVAIGLQFYGRIQQQSLLDMKEKFTQLDTVKLSLLVTHLPELVCTSRNIVEGACFDLDKVKTFARYEQDKYSLYYDILRENVLWIDVVYPYQERILLYDGSLGDGYVYSIIPHPINLYNSTSRTYSLGVLYIQSQRREVS